ncbi:hypothetical protein BSKO_10215 [Bryopsis sp. KO-2023]|nr:hypothetical protein BSKO_10215 [Bryopsis sp. KO-2023]
MADTNWAISKNGAKNIPQHRMYQGFSEGKRWRDTKLGQLSLQGIFPVEELHLPRAKDCSPETPESPTPPPESPTPPPESPTRSLPTDHHRPDPGTLFSKDILERQEASRKASNAKRKSSSATNRRSVRGKK